MSRFARPGRYLDVTVAGASRRVRVRDDGPRDAPALLVVHGFTGSSDWWDVVAEDLAADHRVVRFDLLGHGATGGPSADAPEQTEVAAAVLEQLDVRDVTAVGHSFGADVAAGLAEAAERVTAVVLVCQAPDYADATLPRGHLLMTRPVVGTALLGAGHLLALVAGGVSTVVRRPADPATRRLVRLAVADFRAVDAAMFTTVLVTRPRRMTRRPLDAQLRDAGKPALVLLGGRDHFYGDRSAGRYRAAGARVEVIGDSGHSIQYEQPALVGRLLREFVGERRVGRRS
ncbi:Pimeloyl-ACP methyl ester carboxylesterase [Jatrophihabitans endophyticus]|uniref:Pimeloyl-ACP methyl ester carboxylesterase n=1 Tax=Jatrophihabitans endophyticus TaxID=1206085 RepID=A0A1M5DYQ4_9ACTN|nr:alpha/beta hydrolase [Jatrophihabitans endophyticus]SHF72127.1 Pimeloyl-ACP methyl ester carboxylesterase [Jatrophihabitans endophyticus]